MKFIRALIAFIIEYFTQNDIKEITTSPITDKPTTETNDEKASEIIKETVSNTKGELSIGAELTLKQVALYANATTQNKSNTISGVYYVWDSLIVNNRIRITNLTQRVGVDSQVTGWINVSAVRTENESDKPKAEDGNEQNEPIGLRQKFVLTAKSQIGYSVGTYKVNKYTRWYTGGSNAFDWCGMFVVWVARTAGANASVIPKSAYVPYFYDWYKSSSRTMKAADPKVAAGDLIIFDWNANALGDHIGIIEKVDEDNIYTIEGNTSPYAVTQRTIKRTDKRILAVAKPNF